MTATDIPSIDIHGLFTRCQGNFKLAMMLLGSLESTGRRQAEDILRHSCQDNLTAAAEIAHSLKGAAGILCAEPLRLIAAQIEQSGREGDHGTLKAAAPNLLVEMDRCLARINEIRAAVTQPGIVQSVPPSTVL